MWPFSSLDKKFDSGVEKIKEGKRPFDDSFFDILDDLIKQV